MKFKLLVNKIRTAIGFYNINSLSERGFYKKHYRPEYRAKHCIEDRVYYANYLSKCIDSLKPEDRNSIQWLTEYQIEDCFDFEDDKEYNDDIMILYRISIGWKHAYIVWKKDELPCVGKFKTYNDAKRFITETYGITMEDFKDGKRRAWVGGTFEVAWYVK